MRVDDASELRRAIEAHFRAESARLVASLVRRVRDVGLAEQLAQEAFVAALEQWPRDGVPAQPGAWLMAAAQRRGIDVQRRERVRREHEDEVAAVVAERGAAADPAVVAEVEVGDDVLRLMFLCCHPSLPPDARTALTLRLVAGLTTAEIARAYLVPEATIAQRLVRAKRTLAEQQAAFELPAAGQRAARLAAVLEAVYLLFNEGYAGTSGDRWTRPELCEEALRLARALAALAPHEREVHGLAALLELQSARLPARAAADGAAVLLADQDRARWDRVLLRRGFDALARADALPGAPGAYELQAAIAACHGRARSAAETDWPHVVALNRAVAVGMAFGPAAGLHLADELAATGELDGYHLLPSVRGDLLQRLGRGGEARAEFERAAAATGNERERALLLARARACAPPGH